MSYRCCFLCLTCFSHTAHMVNQYQNSRFILRVLPYHSVIQQKNVLFIWYAMNYHVKELISSHNLSAFCCSHCHYQIYHVKLSTNTFFLPSFILWSVKAFVSYPIILYTSGMLLLLKTNEFSSCLWVELNINK